MNLIELFKRIKPYVHPYRWLVIVTLILTLIGSLMAQVNAIVLDRTVDAINALVNPEGFAWSKAARILTIITIVLLGKEILSAGITFAQNFFGEKMRINVSKDLSQAVIDRMLTYRMGFFSAKDNETGKLQTRIDQGVSSLSSTVQNFFIDLSRYAMQWDVEVDGEKVLSGSMNMPAIAPQTTQTVDLGFDKAQLEEAVAAVAGPGADAVSAAGAAEALPSDFGG